MDNTLYDWVEFFVPAFYAMVAVASRLLNVDEERLLDDLQAVHRERGSVEHPFSLLETSVVREGLPGLTARERHDRLQPAFESFNAVRSRHLQLYSGVREALVEIRARGCGIAAHTESTSASIAVRVRLLGLSDVLDEIFAPPYVGEPHPAADGSIAWESDLVIPLPLEMRKPDPKIPRLIAERFGVPVDESLYVGDSLTNDIAMGHAAGMHTAWARYGTQHNPGLWKQLVRVTHWSPTMVARSSEHAREAVHPEVTLDAFGDVLEHFTFETSPLAGGAKLA